MLQDDILWLVGLNGDYRFWWVENKPHRVFKAGPVFTDQGDFDPFTSQE